MTRKYFLLTLAAWLLCSMSALAIPADPTPVTITQPDGSTVTVRAHGDEFFHYTATTDGFTVIKNEDGYYTYACVRDGQLTASDQLAHDPSQRTAAEQSLLAITPRHLTTNVMQLAASQMLNRRNSVMRRVGADGHMDYDKFRGLIILINYNDKSFAMDDAQSFYDGMVNTKGYSGYTASNGRQVRCPGSVRDYFCDNSMGIFDPVFDVVGPVTVPYSCTYPQSTSNSDAVFLAALDSIDGEVDFSQYDSDGNGEVDMVFFLVAGFSANFGGNDAGYLWPHMYYLWNAPQHDGMSFGLYACSTEIYGWENYYYDTNGIGTFCHEFSHVLGLPDLYDTDYTGSGGESNDPGDWDVMASGSSFNVGRSPVGYSLYERYALGFATPVVIDGPGAYSMKAINESNMGYRLNTPVDKEFFLLETRRQTGWDKYLPGEGMLVARVDSTSDNVWWMNTVNANPAHMYYELLRAGGGGNSAGDPFPGQSRVTRLDNYTTPSLQCWSGEFNEYGIEGISWDTDSAIVFTVFADTTIQSIIEDFEQMPVSTAKSTQGVQGVYAKWDFTKCGVAEPSEAGNCNGKHGVAMTSPSRIATSGVLNHKAIMVSYTIYNPTSMEAHFQLTYSVDSGATWITPGAGYLAVDASEVQTCTVNLPTDAPVMLRINQTSGSNKSKCYLDDIVIHYNGMWNEEITGDVNGDGEVTLADANAVIDLIINGGYSVAADVNGDGEVTLADVNAVIDIILGYAG